MWSENCKPQTLNAQLETASSPAERIDILLTLAHFYTYDARSAQLLDELKPLIEAHPQRRLQTAHFNLLIASQKQSVGDWVGSLNGVENALAIYQECQDARGEVEAMLRLATLRASYQRYDAARTLLESSQAKIEHDSLGPACLALLLNTCAITYMLMGEYDSAERYAKQAYDCGCTFNQTNEGITSKNAVRRRSGPKWSLARTLSLAKRYPEALCHAEEGLAIVQPLNVPYWNASFLAEIGVALTEIGEPKQAIDRLSPTLKQLQPAEEKIYVNSLAALGRAYFAAENYAEAEPVLLRAIDLYTELDIAGPTKPECINKLSKIAAANGCYKKALAYSEAYQQAVVDYSQSRHDQQLERLTAEHEYALKKQEAQILRDSNKKLAKANQLLEDAYSEQAELLNIVVHDINNPLSAITLQADLLAAFAQKDQQAKVIEYSEKIESSAHYIAEIVDQLQTVAKLDEGQIACDWQAIPISKFLLNTIEQNQVQAQAKNIEIKFRQEADVHVWVDPVTLRQVLDNVLSNSIKYSWPNSAVQVQVRLHEAMVSIDCIDQGVGIDEAELPKLFSKYGRLSSSQPTAHERSTGLGLYITQRLIHLMQGNITAHSDGLEHGTTFTISLPVHRPAE